MDLNLAGRVVIVTGASKGIGYACAAAFAAEGAKVALVSRSQANLDARPINAVAAIGVLLGLVLNVNVGFELSRYSAVAILAALGGRDGHAEGRADGRAGMADTERVEVAFAARWKGRQALVLLDGVQERAPPGQYLMRIGLMAHVPDQPVVRRIEDIVQRNGKFHRP